MKITVGIPAFNEEKNIASIISRLKVFTDSIIVCDDGSSDMTAKIAECIAYPFMLEKVGGIG